MVGWEGGSHRWGNNALIAPNHAAPWPLKQIVDTFVGLFNGAGLGTGLALRSDSSLLICHPSPGETLHTVGIPTCSFLPCSTCQTGLLLARCGNQLQHLFLFFCFSCIALAFRDAAPLLLPAYCCLRLTSPNQPPRLATAARRRVGAHERCAGNGQHADQQVSASCCCGPDVWPPVCKAARWLALAHIRQHGCSRLWRQPDSVCQLDPSGHICLLLTCPAATCTSCRCLPTCRMHLLTACPLSPPAHGAATSTSCCCACPSASGLGWRARERSWSSPWCAWLDLAAADLFLVVTAH